MIRKKNTSLLVAILLASLTNAEVQAQASAAASLRIVPPAGRAMYIMPVADDSARFTYFRRLLGDTIVYNGLISQGTFTEMKLPVLSIARIEMAELVDWQEHAQRGAIFGGLAGIAVGGGGAAIAGKSPGKPAIIGALAGALVGYILGGQSAEGRVLCWRTILQRADADSSRYAAMRTARSPEPACR